MTDKTRFVHPQTYHIYTDGSFRPPDAASCAYLIYHERSKSVVDMNSFPFRGSTINHMELMGINKALDYPNLKYVIIYSDSMYTISCLVAWRKSWARNGWRLPSGEPVKNKELIQEIGAKIDALKYVRFVKVKAHTGDPYNTVVDHLATTLTQKMLEDFSIEDGKKFLK